jgi:hypothetical protein
VIGWTPEQIAQRNTQYRRQEMSNNMPVYRLEALDDSGWEFKMQGRDYLDLVSVGDKWVAGKFCTEYRITQINP